MKSYMKKYYPTEVESFKFSDGWFNAFCPRFKISLRKKTHISQKRPEDALPLSTNFHTYLFHIRKRGQYSLADIANMDQTGLPFIMDDGKTYANKGSDDVSCLSGQSGLEKRQATAQLTIFADGGKLKPLIIFRGKGLRIDKKEQEKWDRRVKVVFQPNAWCDEPKMIQWIREDWGNYFDNPPTPGSDGKILVVDVHRAQQTPTVKSLLSKCKTSLVDIPPELTSYIQVLDVSINKTFKDQVRKQSEKHVEENIDRYAEGKYR